MTCLQVTLKECDTFDLRVLKGPSDYMAAANSTETTEKIEACMKVWIKQIEQVRSYIVLKHITTITFYCCDVFFFVVQCSLWSDLDSEFRNRFNFFFKCIKM